VLREKVSLNIIIENNRLKILYMSAS